MILRSYDFNPPPPGRWSQDWINVSSYQMTVMWSNYTHLLYIEIRTMIDLSGQNQLIFFDLYSGRPLFTRNQLDDSQILRCLLKNDHNIECFYLR